MAESPSNTGVSPPPTVSCRSSFRDADQIKMHNQVLWYKIQLLIFDLRSFGTRPDSAKRLDKINDVHYLGLPYFQPDEAQSLKALPVVDEAGVSITLEGLLEQTMAERLERRASKASEKGDNRPCTAHDLAPVFERVFTVQWKQLKKSDEFVRSVEKHDSTEMNELQIPEADAISINKSMSTAKKPKKSKKKRK